MTKDKDFKKLVRARMGETGEPFTTCRAQLLAERPTEPTSQTPQARPNRDAPVVVARPNGVDALLTQLDTAIRARDLGAERARAEHARQRHLVEEFVGRASSALHVVAEVLNQRASELRLDSPVTVETTIDADGKRVVSACVLVSMTKSRRDRDVRAHAREASAAYSWTLRVAVSVEHHDAGPSKPSISIEANRDGWQDALRCDIPTPECDPDGLSLASSGDEVAQRFMAWFTKYLT